MKNKTLLIICALIFTSGCATVSKEQIAEYMFYPPLPQAPRIQYLTSISSSRDIESESSSFYKFIVGDVPKKTIMKPYGVNLRYGKIYVCDTVARCVEIMDVAKKGFEYFKPTGSSALQTPINTEVSPEGKLYVADTGRGQVLIFSSNKKYLTAIGSRGELKPTDVQIWKGRIFVCDLASHSVRVYDTSNNAFLYSIPAADETAKEKKLYSPTNLDIDDAGNVYISDIGSSTVKKYTSDGEFLRSFGVHGDALGQFARPKGVAVDKEGRVYVVDAAFQNVQVFNPDGRLLLFFPETGDPVDLTLPAGMCIDYDHTNHFLPYTDPEFKVDYLILVVSQYGPRKISVFGFGQRL